jgi:hypothetical protein
VEKRLAIAEKIWPSHPQVSLAQAMAEIGQAAAAGKTSMPAAALRRTESASRLDPLAVEPFLIKGALAKTKNDEGLAERLFVEARSRDPRSAAARYFLAERYLSSGRASQGLSEMTTLGRLVPGGMPLITPGLAKYALTPGAVPYLRKMFAANPDIGQVVLADLASNAANTKLILQLAGPASIGSANEPPPEWQGRLLNSLIERGEFGRAQLLWSKFSGIQPSNPPGPINTAFAKINAPPPFNWTFSSGNFGVAEPAAEGQLKVIFYGREEGDLASQLMVLPPGHYRIRMTALSDANGDSGLEWSVTCLPGKTKIASIPFKTAKPSGSKLEAMFTVPSQGCAAQSLKFSGNAQEIAKSEQATVDHFDLTPVGTQ